jgi:hypothetical protein
MPSTRAGRTGSSGVTDARLWQARLRSAPFVIPDLKTSNVQLKGPAAKVQCDPFHQQLVPREDRVAGVACFTVAWITPNPFDALIRQAPVLELASDEAAEGFLVHSGIPRSGGVLLRRLAPLLVPEGETIDVHLNGLPTADR